VKLEVRIRIGKDGRMVVSAARKALGIKAGEVIVLRIENDELQITTLKQRIARGSEACAKVH
jgi:bifunctional DNA-binding transcriptional regulator/antitoxin component of YhaV-PrlF toxin-antitoxin module